MDKVEKLVEKTARESSEKIRGGFFGHVFNFDDDTKNQQIENTFFPSFVYPHANDYCAIIGGTNLNNFPKWSGYFFVGDFCTGTIWAINNEKNSQLIVLEKNIVPYSITTINDSENGTLLVGTTSGTILELILP